MGAEAVKVVSIAELEEALKKARAAKTTQVIVIDTTRACTRRLLVGRRGPGGLEPGRGQRGPPEI